MLVVTRMCTWNKKSSRGNNNRDNRKDLIHFESGLTGDVQTTNGKALSGT